MFSIPSIPEPALYIIDFENYTEEIISLLSGHNWSDSDCLLFYNSVDPADISIKTGQARVVMARDIISQSEARSVDRLVKNMSRKWYDGTNPNYKGVRLGPLAEYPIILYLVQLFKDVLLVEKMLKISKPKKVYVLSDRESFTDFSGIFDVDYEIVLRGNRKSLKEQILEQGPRFANRHLDILFKTNIAKKLAGSEKSILLDLWFKPHVEEALRQKGYGIVKLHEETLAQSAHNLKESNASNLAVDKIVLKNRAIRRKSALKKWDIAITKAIAEGTFQFGDYELGNLVGSELSMYRETLIMPLLRYIDIWSKQLRSASNIKFILLSNDVFPHHKALVQVAKGLKIRSVLVQHGILASELAHDKLLVDTAVLWGPFSKKWYRKFGNDDVGFEITGNPHFDHYALLKPFEIDNRRRELQDRYNITPADRVVVFATQWEAALSAGSFFGNIKRVLFALVDEVLDKPYITLLLRLHPSESESSIRTYQRYVDKLGLGYRVIIDRELELIDSLIISDVVVTAASTVGLEAMLLNKPVIVINLTGRPSSVPYVEYGAATGAFSKTELGQALDKVIERSDQDNLDNDWSRFVSDFAGTIDGCATKRLVELLS